MIEIIRANDSNVINQAPDSQLMIKAFAKVDFNAVVDAFMTETARHAAMAKKRPSASRWGKDR